MRNYLLFCLFLLSMTGCVESALKNNKQLTGKEEVDNLITTTDYKVEVREGYTTCVMYKGQLIASTSKPMTILVPKNSSVTKSSHEDIEVYFQPGESAKSISTLWQTVLFEDSKAGDFDYNDLVFRAKYNVIDNNMQVSLHPIALGSRKNIKLGFRWVQGSRSGEVIVADNCRSDIFDGKAGFINTHRYDIHYNTFKKVINIPISGVTEPVNIWWFIVVDNNNVIYAVNDAGIQSRDIKGMPYGFAITDARPTAVSPAKIKGMTRFSPTDDEWNRTIAPETPEWAAMPAVPVIPADAESMDKYTSWGSKGGVFVLERGKKYSAELYYKKDFKLYVEGELTLNNESWSNGNTAMIYVMPGGKLIVPSKVENVNIVNFGEMELGSSVLFQKTTIQSTTLEAPRSELRIETSANVYVQGAVAVKALLCSNKSALCAGSLNVQGKLNITNNSKAIVRDEVVANEVEVNSSTSLYVGCQLQVASLLYVTNNGKVSVKGNLTSQTTEFDSNATLNMMSGGVHSCDMFEINNVASCDVNIIGTDKGAIVTKVLNLSGGLNISKTFNGNMFLTFGELQEKGQEISLSNNRLKLPAQSVMINSTEAKVEPSACSPGFNPGGDNAAETMGWFPYPMENKHIEDCYNFQEWIKGRYDYTLKPSAPVFDIYNSNPLEGDKKPVYQMK